MADDLLAKLPQVVQAIAVTSAAQMQQALVSQLAQTDWIIMAAAVADVQPATTSPEKLPKASLPNALPLVPVPDIVAELATLKHPRQRLIGFAAQSGDIIAPAKEKLHRKQLDAIVANPIDQPHSGFGSDTNQAVLIDKRGRQQAIVQPCTKLQLAHYLYDFVQAL
jgi:phosphopantothenoylcysteine decarboxylase/phosphopantothenate--cysteine ligase